MNEKIFRSTVTVAMLVFLASLVLIMGILSDYFERQIQNELKSEAVYIAHAIEHEGKSYFDGFKSEDRRITLISPNGNVTADTAAETDVLDNHSERDEVKQAFELGEGMSIRYSDTLIEKNVYYAVLLKDGSVLRVSTKQYTVMAVLLGLLRPMIFVFIIAVVLSFLLSSRVSKSIVKPINDLDPDNPQENQEYEELAPLLGKLSAQKKTIDRQLREAKQKQEEFRLITENMSEGFLLIDKNKNIFTHNTSALKLLGIDEADGENALALNRTKDFREVIEKALGGSRAQSEMKLDERCFNLIANPVFEDGYVIGAVIVILDVTESAHREQLRREFTSNVSHELKTPLTSISGFAEIMKSGGTPDETVMDFSKSIYDEAQRLISLVNDIIKISELDEKSTALEKEQVDLYELSKEIAARLKLSADKAGVRLSVSGGSVCDGSICDCSYCVYGVRKILDEMIYNLCDNAIKYNKENGSVEISVSTDADKMLLTVSDTGIGIPLPHQSRVFERFYRVDKSHSKAIGGTGLGLSIVKHGAVYHNAEISLESTEGVGTSITVSFDKM